MSFAYALSQHRSVRVKMESNRGLADLVELYTPHFSIEEGTDFEGAFVCDPTYGDRLSWYQAFGLNREEYPVFLPLSKYLYDWANSVWGSRRRCIVQRSGSCEAKRYRFMDQVIRWLTRKCFVIWDFEKYGLAKGLALCATCHLYVGYDSGPFWAALSHGASAVAMFPYGRPDMLYLPYPHAVTSPIYCHGDCNKVPIPVLCDSIISTLNLSKDSMHLDANEDGMYFIGENTHDHLYKGHERWLEQFMKIEQGAICADIGAHNGVWSTYWARNGAGRVYAVEPSPGPFMALHNTLFVRGHSQVVPMNIGLGDEAKKSRISRECGGSHLGDEGDPVSVETIDSVFGTLNRLDIIKIDTEGHEARILRGGRKTLARLRPKMIIEVHQFAAGRYDEDPYGAIVKELSEMGCRFRILGGHHSNFYLEAIWK